jgi:hypothetical protein
MWQKFPEEREVKVIGEVGRTYNLMRKGGR